MPSTPCAIVVDPEGKTVTVDITRHIGDATSTPTTYTTEHGSTAHTLPLEISTETEFWLTEPGDYTVSVLYNGNEIAGGAPSPGESGQAVRREVGHGQRWRIVPSVDTEELRSGASPSPLTASDTVTVHRVDRRSVAAASYSTVFDVTTGGVELLGGSINGAEAGVRLTIDGTVVFNSIGYALGIIADGSTVDASISLPWAKAETSMRLEVYNINPAAAKTIGWTVFTR